MIARAAARYPLGRAGESHGVQSILVCGGGPAGLLFTQYLRNVLGYEGLLLVSEPNARRRALAERFGAETVDPSSTDIVEAVAERTKGRRAELLHRVPRAPGRCSRPSPRSCASRRRW